jgi:hypothetical protein
MTCSFFLGETRYVIVSYHMLNTKLENENTTLFDSTTYIGGSITMLNVQVPIILRNYSYNLPVHTVQFITTMYPGSCVANSSPCNILIAPSYLLTSPAVTFTSEMIRQV